jgi:hypothetical protein
MSVIFLFLNLARCVSWLCDCRLRSRDGEHYRIPDWRSAGPEWRLLCWRNRHRKPIRKATARFRARQFLRRQEQTQQVPCAQDSAPAAQLLPQRYTMRRARTHISSMQQSYNSINSDDISHLRKSAAAWTQMPNIECCRWKSIFNIDFLGAWIVYWVLRARSERGFNGGNIDELVMCGKGTRKWQSAIFV